MTAQGQGWIQTVDELISHYGSPGDDARAKELTRLSEDYRNLIEASPFMALATVGPSGADCSPRGDRPSAAVVVDHSTLHIPDRLGNNRVDSLRNIIEDGRIALLFLLPGIEMCMRVNGRARVSIDPEVLARHAIDDDLPRSVIVVTIEAAFFQSSGAIRRSMLWDPAIRLSPGDVPTM